MKSFLINQKKKRVKKTKEINIFSTDCEPFLRLCFVLVIKCSILIVCLFHCMLWAAHVVPLAKSSIIIQRLLCVVLN